MVDFDAVAQQLFDVRQQRPLLEADQRDGVAFAAGPAGAADR
jgi:hypothetical protein